MVILNVPYFYRMQRKYKEQLENIRSKRKRNQEKEKSKPSPNLRIEYLYPLCCTALPCYAMVELY